MTQYQDQFSPSMDVESPAKISRTLIIASSQRSGSHLLGHTVKQTGGFGVPLEYLNEANLKWWKERFQCESLMDILSEIERVRTSPNGVFSLKSHYFQLATFGTVNDLITRYGDCRFVSISRQDIVRQAISRTIAMQTGAWMADAAPQRQPSYDYNAIVKNMHVLIRQRVQWEMALEAHGCKYIKVSYEDLVDSPAAIIHRVADLMDVDAQTLTIPQSPPIRVQSASHSKEWAQRFRNEFKPDKDPLLTGYGGVKDHMIDVIRRAVGPYKQGSKKVVWERSPNLKNMTRP